ncbi:OmpA family protein [Shimia thalassica]|nr:OmpA family protein [Shimia thalassica]PHO02976.1 cell envelope biogenesis protein OmpA [Rhodobacteraceae bacterium 4F10]MBU2942976.1 OmpA family protein [Shimia thalassica]MDO6479173.1 OmpA family protein [Shimia thalassica]MDO6482200.1 OmpA family protein [Shimia thalassica]MDO6502701.1 OmpA family protein [Shimia thalassica]
MADKTTHKVRAAIGGIAAICIAAVSLAQPAAAQTQRTVLGQEYVPTVWVDPDGCEHWVMDDGAEGYMTPHVSRQGIPVCRRGNVCGVMNSDQFFATDKYYINSANKQRLQEFFQTATASAFIIAGHTDSRASDEYNMRLSYNRANSVAKVAQSTGARVVDVRGYGERMPRASNGTSSGMAQNRRVEIICLR